MSAETFSKVNTSYIEWRTIIAGATLACAISTVLVQFGAAVGLTQIANEASADANITPAKVLATGIWLLWTQVMASLAGGYLAGRMRMPISGASEHERDMRDGIHGLLVWATATIAVILFASAGAALTGLADRNAAEEAMAVADVNVMEENATIIFAFCAAATSLVSGVISWWAATVGGDHRDTNADHTRYFTFRVIR